jgi:hypothetical protein
MAKRLTDSNKWNDSWFTNLPMDIKLVWIYLLDTCDHAGVYKTNIRLLKFQTGTERTEEELIEFFKERIYITGDKWFIPKFVNFQYKNFFTNNAPAVKSARELLINHSIIKPNDNSFITLKQPLLNPSIRTKDKDTDKDTDMDKDKAIDINTDKNKRMAMNTVNILANANSLDIDYDNAVEYWKELGGINGVSKIMGWDSEQKLNWENKLNNIYSTKNK